MKLQRKKLPPMPPNQGVMKYPIGEQIVDILDAIKRYEKGERSGGEENHTKSVKDIDAKHSKA